jgi:hypothetical protein
MRFFGYHPDYIKAIRSNEKKGIFLFPKDVPLSDFLCEDHPDVYLIPRDRPLVVVDEWGESIDHSCLQIVSFSSFDFYVSPELKKGVFVELDETKAFLRLAGINQLEYLHSPPSINVPRHVKTYYMPRQFSHTRWHHSRLVAMMGEVLLARNGFSKEERDPFVLGASLHDIATPAGGDSVMHIDPKRLSEEENFSLVLRRHGLDRKWSKKFGFNLAKAEQWIRGHGPWGGLLDVIDKVAYTIMDADHIGYNSDNLVRRYCLQYPLVGDVWQDIRFDGTKTWFISPDRLFRFLVLRAYNHTELYLNPRSRSLDYTLYNKVKKYYESGEIKRDDLLNWNDQQLERWLEKSGEIENWPVSPDDLEWFSFKTEAEAGAFAKKEKHRFSHLEHVRAFKTGLDWLVKSGRHLTPLRFVLPQRKVEQLEYLSRKYEGWYVHCFRDDA